MWHHMFVEQIPVGEKLLRTVIVYALVAVLLRIVGKRDLAGLNSLDIAVVFLLSNVVQNAIIGDDLSITGGAIGAVTLITVNSLLNRLSLHSKRFSRIFDGRETRVIEDGKVLPDAMRQVGLRLADLKHAVRLQDGEDISHVEKAVLEPSGQLIVTLRKGEQNASRSDLDKLRRQLDRIEAALATSS